jgi:hypothetical protein
MATQTRINSMGGMDIWLRDDVNLDWNPALLPWYAEQVSAEYGVGSAFSDFQGIAVRLTNDDEQSAGVFSLVLNPHPEFPLLLPVSNPSPGLSQPSDVPDASAPFLEPEQFWKLMWGKRWEKFAAGLAVNMGGRKQTFDSSGVVMSEDKISLMGFNPGIVLELGENSVDIEVGGRFNSTSFSNETNALGISEEKTAGSHITVGGRAWFELEDYGYFVPGFGFNSSEMSWEDRNPPGGPVVEFIDKRSSLFAGAGLQVMPSEETTVLVGFYYGSLSNEFSDPGAGGDTTITETNTTLPGWVVGVESALTSWMDGRIGASKHGPRASKDEILSPYEMEFEETDAPFDLNVGVALHFMDFRVDGLFEPDFLFDGPYFIGGDSNQTFAQVSVVYNFSGM